MHMDVQARFVGLCVTVYGRLLQDIDISKIIDIIKKTNTQNYTKIEYSISKF